jgi:N-acetylmuramoyl-L-alanine amidase
MDNPLDTKTLTIEDAGHGGADPGAVGPLFPEKDLTLQISLYRHRRFKELCIPTVLVRNTDETVDPATHTATLQVTATTPGVVRIRAGEPTMTKLNEAVIIVQ